MQIINSLSICCCVSLIGVIIIYRFFNYMNDVGFVLNLNMVVSNMNFHTVIPLVIFYLHLLLVLSEIDTLSLFHLVYMFWGGIIILRLSIVVQGLIIWYIFSVWISSYFYLFSTVYASSSLMVYSWFRFFLLISWWYLLFVLWCKSKL